jgi:hypothetical protein
MQPISRPPGFDLRPEDLDQFGDVTGCDEEMHIAGAGRIDLDLRDQGGLVG